MTDSCLRRSAIESVATAYRHELEEYLDFRSNPHTIIGWCRKASMELATRLDTAGFTAIAIGTSYMHVPDSYPDLFRETFEHTEHFLDDFDGTWMHWVVLADGWVVDVTSDQFHLGEPDSARADPVVVVELGDTRYSLGCEGSQPAFSM